MMNLPRNCQHALYFCKTLIAQFPSEEIFALICEHMLELKMVVFVSRIIDVIMVSFRARRGQIFTTMVNQCHDLVC